MRHEEEDLSSAFDLDPWSYFLDFALVPLAIVALLWFGQASVAVAAGSVMAGVGAWTLAEYWIHRGISHGPTRFEPMHQMHHALPKDFIGVASWGTFGAFATIWLALAAAIGVQVASAFTAGVMLGYLFYCAIHVRFHHHSPGARLSWYVGFMNRHHVGHHRGGKGNFGVSSPIWDFVFGTYRRSR